MFQVGIKLIVYIQTLKVIHLWICWLTKCQRQKSQDPIRSVENQDSGHQDLGLRRTGEEMKTYFSIRMSELSFLVL